MVIDRYQITSGLVKILIVAVISGCTIVGEPPVIDKSTTQRVFVAEKKSAKSLFGRFRASKVYLVKKGDTLYSIAWKYGVSYQSLANQNNIVSPFVIYPGQKLSLSTSHKRKNATKKVVVARNDVATLDKKKAPQTESVAGKLPWEWPIKSKPSVQYSSANKGVDYLLSKPTSLTAAGNGSVVYEGGGIGGYENLIIIKHSNELLSAYSFNGGAKIKEQQIVGRGDILASINPDSKSQERVHFEVRKNGRPIDPSTLIKASI